MGGPFDWGNSGKDSKLPRHIERMNAGTRPAEMKKSSDGNLPWGGTPSEKSKAYCTGAPKSKGSMKNPLGERGTKGTKSLPQGNGKAHNGFKPTIKSKSQKSGY